MVSVLPQQNMMGDALQGLMPALFQQNMMQQQQQGIGQSQIDQLMALAKNAGIEDTSEFQKLLINSGLFGKGPNQPQNLMQQLIGNPIGQVKSGIAGGFNSLQELLGDFAVNTLPGRVT